MLDALRNGAKSWISKLLMLLLVMSFAVWGISGNMLTIGSDKVATVGDESVSLEQFDLSYRRELQRIGRSIGRPLSTVEGASFGLPGQVLGQLVAEAALDQTAADLNLGVSNEELVRLIQSAPSFQRPDAGGFDRALLARVLQANGMSEDEFIAERRRFEERRQIADSISGGITTPSPMLEVFNRHANEERKIAYVVLPKSSAGEIADPDEAALSAYFDANKARFAAPEYRAVSLLKLTPQEISRPDEVTEDEIKQEYEASGDRFGEPERRHILQLTLSGPDARKKAEALLAEGKSFDEILTEFGTTADQIDLGSLTRAELVDPAIAEAAFALGEGEVSGLVEGRFAPVLLRIVEVTPAHKTPLADVSDELRTQVALRKAEREILDLHDEIEDARAGGATLAEVAERFKLKLETPPAFDSDGKGENGQAVELPDVPELVGDVFESDIGVEADVLQLGRDGFMWFEVTKVTPARDRTLDEVRADVVAAWKEQERGKKLDAMAAEIETALKDGGAFDQIAAGKGLEVKTAQGVKRASTDTPLPQAAVSGAFTGPVGVSGAATGPDGTRYVYVVTDTSVPAFFREAGEIAALDQRLAQALQTSVIGQYVQEREKRLGVSFNQANINRVIGQGG